MTFRNSLLLVVILALSSCVTKKKYTQLDTELQEQRALSQQFRVQMDSMQKVNSTLNDSIILLDSLLTLERNRVAKKTGNPNAPKKSSLSKSEEYDKKSVYLQTFSRQVIWPATPKGDKFVIGILGSSLIYDKIKKAAGDNKKVMGKTLAVRTVSVAEISDCQILFIPHAQINELAKVRSILKNSPVLIVTEEAYSNGLATHINFVVDDNRIRYKVNKEAAEKCGLKITTDLLSFGD